MRHHESERAPDAKDGAGKVVGRRLALSVPRRIICDLLAFAEAVPCVPVQRRMNVAGVAAARARVALAFPELRRAYLPFPRPCLYEHPHSIASIAVERQYEGENAIFWGHLRRPERQSLRELQTLLRRYKDEPIHNFGLFRRMLLVGRLPRPLRRLAWWLGLNVSGRKRAGY